MRVLPDPPPAAGAQGYSASSDQLVARLGRIEGQVRGMARMVEGERHCLEVLQQISAVRAALDKVALGLVDAHVRERLTGGDEARRAEFIDEVMLSLGRLLGRSPS